MSDAKMKVSMPRGILLQDFEVLREKVLVKDQSKFLDGRLEKKLLAFRAATGKGLDGSTIGPTKKGKKNRKQVTVCVSKDVLMSHVKCWRLAVLLHKLGHALHFFSNRVTINKVVPTHLHHGKCWKNMLYRAIKDDKDNEKLKSCAGSEESPKETCLYGGLCPWCGPKKLRKRGVKNDKK